METMHVSITMDGVKLAAECQVWNEPNGEDGFQMEFTFQELMATGDIWELLDGRVQQSIMKKLRFSIEEIQERQANENAMDMAEEKHLQRMEQ